MMKGTGNVPKQWIMSERIKIRELVVRDICKFLYGYTLVFNLVKNSLFALIMKSISKYGRGLKLPLYLKLELLS